MALKIFKDLTLMVEELRRGEKPTFNEFNFMGSRGSGKTVAVEEALIQAFLMKDKQNIIYVFRQKVAMLEEMKMDIFPKLEALGFHINYGHNGNFNNKLQILSNGDNKMIFKALNEERMDVKKGQGAGINAWLKADNIIAFYEECSALNEDLLRVVNPSIRGHTKTNIVRIYVSNPWDPLHWFVDKCSKMLPEDLLPLDTVGFQKRAFYDEERKMNVLFIRNNYLVNPYYSQEEKNNIEAMRETAFNYFKISGRGMAGMLGDLIYANNLEYMHDVKLAAHTLPGSYLQGGLDWGDGSSSGASPTTMHFGSINPISGVDIYEEETIWNNKGYKHETTEQIDKVIQFYIKQYLAYGRKPFKVFIDQQLPDHHKAYNARLFLHGADTSMIEFRPCRKNYSINDERIPTINLMLSAGLFRVDKDKCPGLYSSLANANWETPKHLSEGQQRKRAHAQTHWINSGAEYILDDAMGKFKEKYNNMMVKK